MQFSERTKCTYATVFLKRRKFNLAILKKKEMQLCNSQKEGISIKIFSKGGNAIFDNACKALGARSYMVPLRMKIEGVYSGEAGRCWGGWITLRMEGV